MKPSVPCMVLCQSQEHARLGIKKERERQRQRKRRRERERPTDRKRSKD